MGTAFSLFLMKPRISRLPTLLPIYIPTYEATYHHTTVSLLSGTQARVELWPRQAFIQKDNSLLFTQLDMLEAQTGQYVERTYSEL